MERVEAMKLLSEFASHTRAFHREIRRGRRGHAPASVAARAAEGVEAALLGAGIAQADLDGFEKAVIAGVNLTRPYTRNAFEQINFNIRRARTTILSKFACTCGSCSAGPVALRRSAAAQKLLDGALGLTRRDRVGLVKDMLASVGRGAHESVRFQIRSALESIDRAVEIADKRRADMKARVFGQPTGRGPAALQEYAAQEQAMEQAARAAHAQQDALCEQAAHEAYTNREVNLALAARSARHRYVQGLVVRGCECLACETARRERNAAAPAAPTGHPLGVFTTADAVAGLERFSSALRGAGLDPAGAAESRREADSAARADEAQTFEQSKRAAQRDDLFAAIQDLKAAVHKTHTTYLSGGLSAISPLLDAQHTARERVINLLAPYRPGVRLSWNQNRVAALIRAIRGRAGAELSNSGPSVLQSIQTEIDNITNLLLG